jgi:hypothetical protein
MRSRSYPLGNPSVLTREQLRQPPQTPFPWTRPEHNTIRGLLKVRVLPPQRLQLALLPYRTRDGRLTFPLCGACAEQVRVNEPCPHAGDWRRRSWIDAYTHAELNAGLALGYQVIDCFEAWHYDRWSGEEGEPHLFRGYFDTILRWKTEASGWPTGCRTPADREEYILRFLLDGIQLDPAELDKGLNAALRQIAVSTVFFVQNNNNNKNKITLFP